MARGLPDGTAPDKMLSDPLDFSGSTFRCASDGDSQGPPRQLRDPENANNNEFDRKLANFMYPY
eukprot:6691944-Heterocapsa_arctica.AAC.1